MILKFFSKLSMLNLRSIILNFYFLPFKDAIYLPILISNNDRLRGIRRGAIQIKEKKIGICKIGYKGLGTIDLSHERTLLEIKKGGRLIVHGKCSFGAGCRISINENAIFEVGNRCVCTGKSSFIVKKRICLGSDVLISWDCLFLDSDFHKLKIDNRVINDDKSIIVGNHCWINCRVTVLKGADIIENSVIAAGSVVSGKILEKNCVYGGIPVKVLKRNVIWEW